MKRLMMVAAAVCTFVAGGAMALPYSVTFSEIPLVGGVQFTNQYASYDITGSNLYYYNDFRDTFDGKGVAVNFSSTFASGTATISFAAPASNLSIDYLSLANLGSGAFSVLDNNSVVLDTFVVTAGTTNTNASHTFNASNISTLLIADTAAGFLDISGLRFTAGAVPVTPSVPEPASWMLAIGAIGAVGGALRRRQAAHTPRFRVA